MEHSGQFAGKVALVTGAASGMGAATATMLASRGAKVVLVDRQAELLETVTARLRADGADVDAVTADVTEATQVEAAVRRASDEYGALHLAANVAGIAGPAQTVGELDPEGWETVISTNLTSLFLAMRYEIPAMLEAGGGAIVNISSVFADRGQTVRPAYAAAKHGIRGLTRSAVIDYAARGIRVNELQPGVIDTPMLGTDRERTELFAQAIPQRRIGRPEEIASVVCFLLSDEASYVNGAHVSVDGGFLA